MTLTQAQRDAHMAQDFTTAELKPCSLSFEAMAINVPVVEGHPNRVPFSGILTRVDEPSNKPLSGSYSKCVFLPKAVAEAALPSLLGMAINMTTDLAGHHAQTKIGLITEALLDGNAVQIQGYFYGADFPDAVKRIQAEKAQLGFSYEAQAHIRSLDDDPLVIESCIFTGAAVLYKHKAAYTTTALAATAENIMSDETEMLKKQIETLQQEITNLKTYQAQRLEAGSVNPLVRAHADKIRTAADSLETAGLGMEAKRGHVAVLRNMADQMEAEAHQGKLPYVYQTQQYLDAASEKKEPDDTLKVALETIKTDLASLHTKFIDMEKMRFEAAHAPQRKTLDPAMQSLLAKAGIVPESGKLDVRDVDKALEKAGLRNQQSIALKLAMRESGLI